MIAGLLPRSRQGRILAIGALADSAATGLYLAVATLYFVGYIGVSTVSVGVVLGVANFCGLLSPLPVAHLTRRWGVVPVYLSLLLLRALGFVGYALADGYGSYFAVTCLLTAAMRAGTPLLQVVVGQLEGGNDRTRTMASLRVVNNIGLTAGFLIAAGVQLTHSRMAFVALFVACAAAFVVVAAATISATRGSAGSEAPAPRQRTRAAYRDGRFIALAVANAVLLLHDSILFILLPLWVVERCGLSPAVSSVLLTVNTVLTVLLQVSVARFAQGIRGSMRLLRWSVLALGVGCLVLGLADRGHPWIAGGLLFAAVIGLTVGENLHSVAGWELSYQLSDPALRTHYLSLFSMGVTAQMIIGPALMTSVVLPLGLMGTLLVVSLFGFGFLVTMIAVRSHPLTTATTLRMRTANE
jgi:MFS family permease